MSNNEFQIIQKFRVLKNDPLYPFDSKKEEIFTSKKLDIKRSKIELENIESSLNKIGTRIINEYKLNVIESIEKTIELTSINNFGISLSRNQGLIIPNYIFGKVIGTINSALDCVTSYSYSPYYLDDKSDFNSSELINLLNDFKTKLDNTEYKNFIDLDSECEKYIKKIEELWKIENESHPNPR